MSQNSICHVCRGALEHRYNPITKDVAEEVHVQRESMPSLPNEFGHHRTWESLQNSVHAECWICSRLGKIPDLSERAQRVFGFTHDTIYSDRICVHDFVSTITVKELDSGSSGCAEVKVHCVVGETCNQRLLRLELKMMEIPATQFGSSTSLQVFNEANGTASPRSLQVAAHWLQDCLNNHFSCSMHNRKALWYPTRLLDLGEPGICAEHVRLIITQDDAPVSPYATLSHCWGQADLLKLTKSTMDEFREGIRIKNMPKTFQETVVVCRELQIRYLWIDSLCIMQDEDDLSDWTREASLMHKVYKLSHCNISASDAQDGTSGLFRPHDKSAMQPVKIRATVKDTAGELRTKDYYIEEPFYWYVNLAESHIHTRGWVVQERVMAPRVLHFARNQLFWECRQHSACEKYPQGVSHSFLTSANDKEHLDYEPYVEFAKCYGADAKQVANCYNIWDSLVSYYSQASLTRSTDRLIAISGMAKSLAVVSGDTYLAGLWRRNLESQLLWSVFDILDEPHTRAGEYCAPTWSWASIQGKVYMNRERFPAADLKVHIEHVKVVHDTIDPTGQIRDAYLDLQGELKPISVAETPAHGHTCMHAIVHGSKWPLEAGSVDDLNQDVNFLTKASMEHRLFYMTFIATEACVISMLLRLVEGDTNTFERWGLIKLDLVEPDPGEYDFTVALLAELDEDTKRRLPCLRYEGGKHTIRII